MTTTTITKLSNSYTIYEAREVPRRDHSELRGIKKKDRGWQGEIRDGQHGDPHLKSCKLAHSRLQNPAPKSFQEALKQMVNLSWVWPCLSILSSWLQSKRGCGNKLSFHAVESHQAGALLQFVGLQQVLDMPRLMPQLLVPRRMSIPDIRLPEEVLLTLSTVVPREYYL